MFIYKTTNLVNGRIYIGQRAKISNAEHYFGSGIYISKAIKKYGKKNFIREILEDNINDLKTLNEREIYWIKFYNATNPEIGYNIANGGRGNLNPSEEIRKRMSDGRRGKYVGEKAPWFGKKHTEETKKLMSEKSRNPKGVDAPWFGKKMPKASSKYFGVSFYKITGRWTVAITKNRKQTRFGYFKYEIEAALAYNELASEIYGWKASLNKISAKEIEQLWELD